jgi:cell division septation protein DedD
VLGCSCSIGNLHFFVILLLNIHRKMEKPMVMLGYKQLLSGFVSIVFFACLGFSYPVSATNLNSALDRYNVGDYRSAIEQWEQLARMGNPDALFNLGQIYRMGNGVDIDMAKVEYFYRRAAESGHAEAQNNLATLYFFNKNGEVTNRGEALTWWRLAARHGHAQSQYMLAVLHYNGEYLPKDNIQAFAWVVLAREAGVEEALIAERVMRRTLSVNEMTQGRLLSRGLVEKRLDTPNLNVTITDPMAMMSGFPLGNAVGSPPLVVDAPQAPPTPPAPPSATMATSTPLTPPSPPSPPQPRVAENVEQPVAQMEGKFTGWSLQMGSFRSIQNPNALYARLTQEQAALMQGLKAQVTKADMGERGVFYRLLIGPFQNKAEALGHCQKLKAVGYDCIAKAP